MDKRIENVLEDLKTTLGLKHFVLHSYSLTEEVSAFGGHDVLLSADWLPPDAMPSEDEEDLLPDGTVSVSYSLRFKQLRLAVTAGSVSAAEPIAEGDKQEEQFLRWSEQQTGLLLDETLALTNRSERGIEGRIMYKGNPVSTESHFEVEWDTEGRLLSCILPVLASNQFEEGSFSLTLEAIEPLVLQQLTPIRLPIEEEERFADYYAIDEVFIAQDGTVLPYFPEEQAAKFPRTVLEWEAASIENFERQEIHPFRSGLTAEEAFASLEQPHKFLTDEIVNACTQSAIGFLSSELPEESGEWELYRVFRQTGIIEVACRKLEEIGGPLRRKLVLLLDTDTYEVLNFMDSNDIAQLFEGFTQPRVAVVSQEEAYEKMISYITLDPTYVYDQQSGTYKLCGLLDAEECVDAVTGELKQLNDL